MANPKMNVKRLKELRALMSSTKPEVVKGAYERLFDMGNWFLAHITPSVSISPKTGECVLDDPVCNTQACALGNAALYGPFQRAGLRLEFSETIDEEGAKTITGTVKFKDYEDLDAGEAFFGLTPQEARHLFMPQSYESHKSPKEVVNHIDNILDGEYR